MQSEVDSAANFLRKAVAINSATTAELSAEGEEPFLFRGLELLAVDRGEGESVSCFNVENSGGVPETGSRKPPICFLGGVSSCEGEKSTSIG